MGERVKILTDQGGYTLMELLVSTLMFGVIGLAFLAFVSSAAHTTTVENRASLAAQELKNGLELMSTEVRMSSALSPYLVGNTASTVTCTGALSVTSTKVKFLVAQDETSASTSGVQPYYVGYWYDATNKRLMRGEIAGTTITSCTVPAGDPTSSSTAQILAEHVVAIDANGDGTTDPAFSTSGNNLLVNLGVEVDGADGAKLVQQMPISILRRTT